jgi:hypothetical protein
MASRAIAMGEPSRLPISVVLSAIPSFPRPVIERLVSRLIDQLDGLDGDVDLEPNGDERDGSAAEDDWHHHSQKQGLSHLPASQCEDAEEDGPREARPTGSGARAYKRWHIDREEPLP